nr:MAG TPA: hypothetical protein [Caudoviricetes sp.]
MKRDVFNVIMDAENAMGYTRQALAVLDLWMDTWVVKTIPKRTVSQRFTALCGSLLLT